MRLIAIITAVLLAFLGNAQVDPNSNKQLVFKQISHPFMPAITSQFFYFTNDGLIWFSTAKGLTSFDGAESVYYSNSDQSNKYLLTSIKTMAEDKYKNLYIGTAKKVVYFNRRDQTFTELPYTFSDTKKQRDYGAEDIYIDEKGTVYIGSIYSGLFIYDPLEKKMMHLNQDMSKPDNWGDIRLNSVSAISAHATDSNRLWLGTYNGIYIFDKLSLKFTKNFYLTNPGVYKYGGAIKKYFDVQHMEVTDDSTIWFNSYTGGFCRYNTHTGNVKIFLHDLFEKGDQWRGPIISNFSRIDSIHFLLSVFDPHPILFNARTETMNYVPIITNELYDRARYTVNDKSGNTWIFNKGRLYATMPEYLRLRNVLIQRFQVNSNRHNLMNGIYFDTAQKNYIVSGRMMDGLPVLDENFNYSKAIAGPRVSDNSFLRNYLYADHITRDAKGRFWTTDHQVCIMGPGEKKLTRIDNRYPALSWMLKRKFDYILSDKEGNVWLREFSNGNLFRINYLSLLVDTVRLPTFNPSAFYEISDYSLGYDSMRHWIYSSKRTGIVRYDIREKEITIIPEHAIFGSVKKQDSNAKFLTGDNGNIWILIQHYGLRLIDPESFTCIDSIAFGQKGLLNNACIDVKYGGKNKLLLKSRDGIIVYDYVKQRSVIFNNQNGYSSSLSGNFVCCNNTLFVSQAGYIEYYDLANFDRFYFKVRPFLNALSVNSVNVFTRSSHDSVATIKLKWKQNNLSFNFSAVEYYFPERIEYAYRLDGFDKEWQYTNSMNRKINYTRLKPGQYTFRLMAQLEGGNWDMKPVEYIIVISPAFWQTNLFRVVILVIIFGFFYLLYKNRIIAIRKQESRRTTHEREMMELEAKALRSQMNPHFVFNSLNSIKSLINKKENDKAAGYLTTFSKLIRSLFQNSDKREVSLKEELETCQLYTQLEQMRFGDKVEFVFDIDDAIDLKDFKVPALILQPFIENAIWHGLIPKETGGKVTVTVKYDNGSIQCIIDDDGIGREKSKQFKPNYDSTYQSKGIGLTQSRLELDKLLNEREDHIDIIDKVDEDGKPNGTKVIISFKENRN